MGNKCNLILTRLIPNMINLSRKIKFTHLDIRKVPESISVSIKSLMPSAVLGSPIIAKPNIIPLLGKLESNTPLLRHDPNVSRIYHAMLQ